MLKFLNFSYTPELSPGVHFRSEEKPFLSTGPGEAAIRADCGLKS